MVALSLVHALNTMPKDFGAAAFFRLYIVTSHVELKFCECVPNDIGGAVFFGYSVGQKVFQCLNIHTS
jgi:hypothetical protein